MAKTLQEIRQQLKGDTIRDLAKILSLFMDICDKRPEAVYDVMSLAAKARSTPTEGMQQFYRDNASYLYEIFKDYNR